MAIGNVQQLAAAPKQRVFFNRPNFATVLGQFNSSWAASGYPAAGSFAIGNTTTGIIPTSATPGAIAFVDAAPGNQLYLFRAVTYAQNGNGNNNNIYFYDRLWHAGSFTMSAATLNSTPSLAITRGDVTGVNAELWAEITTSVTGGPVTLTATYTNSNGVAGQTATCVVPATLNTPGMMCFSLAAGDVGVQQVTNLTCSATPTTGAFNLVLARRFYEFSHICGGLNPEMRTDFWMRTGLPLIPNGACLAAYLINASSNCTIVAELMLAQG